MIARSRRRFLVLNRAAIHDEENTSARAIRGLWSPHAFEAYYARLARRAKSVVFFGFVRRSRHRNDILRLAIGHELGRSL